MAILNIFKKKKEITKTPPKVQQKAVVLPEKRALSAKPVKKAESQKASFAVRQNAKPWETLKSAHITEKATILGEQGKYVFKVLRQVSKQEIKKSIEGLYNVKVRAVNIVNIPRKKKRLGRTEGFQQGYRKAIVTLAKGQTIDIMPK